ncbi:hypothetical protein GCM10027417_00900 [Glutamicibacter endophyticus]
MVPHWAQNAAGLINPQPRKIRELLPRYAADNLFDDSKFRDRFPDFAVTSHAEGLEWIRRETHD